MVTSDLLATGQLLIDSPARGSGDPSSQLLPDTQGEHDGVTHYEHLDTGVPGTLECGDARGVAGMLTPTALLAVASVMWQAWLP
jgi:hypothetical protein